MKEILDIFYTANHRADQALNVYLPENTEHFPTFVFFHGGGLETGNKEGNKTFIRYLTAHGMAVVNANYRLYPEATYPEFIRDAAAAVAWTKKHIPEYGGDGRIFVGGSSAGAYLSMMLCFDKRYLAVHGMAPTDLSGFVHSAGQPTAHFNVLRERGIDSRRVIVDESAPLYHIGTEPDYPRSLFLVSDNDMKNRLEQTQLVMSTLRHFGYDPNKFTCRIMPGKHCQFEGTLDENGDSVFGKLLVDFMRDESTPE